MASKKIFEKAIHNEAEKLRQFGRSRLLNIPVTRLKNSIEVVNELPNKIADDLLSGRSFKFHSVEDFCVREKIDPKDFSPEMLPTTLPSPKDVEVQNKIFNDRYLQTRKDRKSLKAKLATTRREYARGIEEKGLNTLYLAIGLLQYDISNSSGQSESKVAPLFLIPVEIDRAAKGDQQEFISWAKVDPKFNDALSQKLLDEFGVSLPSFPKPEEEGQIDVEKYLRKVESFIKRKGLPFSLLRRCVLDFYSYENEEIIRDLDIDAWRSNGSPLDDCGLMRSVLLGESLSHDGASSHPFDYRQSDDLWQFSESLPLSCDSSQLDVIHSAVQGRSLVVEGPPGTGKSQTITNLIAGLLSQGKSVLFVAEKSAALNVVYRRLDQIGLAEYSLLLDAKSRSTFSVLDKLKKRFSKGKPRFSQTKLQTSIEELNQTRTLLDTYLQLMHSKSEVTNMTFHEMMWYAQSTSCDCDPTLGLKLDDFELTESNYRKAIDLLESLFDCSVAAGDNGLLQFSAIQYLDCSAFNTVDSPVVRGCIDKAVTASSALQSKVSGYFPDLDSSALKIENLQRIPSVNWLPEPSSYAVFLAYSQVDLAREELVKALDGVDKFTHDWWSIPNSDLELCRSLIKRFKLDSVDRPGRGVAPMLRKLLEDLSSLKELSREVSLVSPVLQEFFKEFELNQTALDSLRHSLHLSENIQIQQLDSQKLAQYFSTNSNYRNILGEADGDLNRLSHVYDVESVNLSDLDLAIENYKSNSRGIFSRWTFSFWKSRRALERTACTRDKNQTFDLSSIECLSESLQKYSTALHDLEDSGVKFDCADMRLSANRLNFLTDHHWLQKASSNFSGWYPGFHLVAEAVRSESCLMSKFCDQLQACVGTHDSLRSGAINTQDLPDLQFFSQSLQELSSLLSIIEDPLYAESLRKSFLDLSDSHDTWVTLVSSLEIVCSSGHYSLSDFADGDIRSSIKRCVQYQNLIRDADLSPDLISAIEAEITSESSDFFESGTPLIREWCSEISDNHLQVVKLLTGSISGDMLHLNLSELDEWHAQVRRNVAKLPVWRDVSQIKSELQLINLQTAFDLCLEARLGVDSVKEAFVNLCCQKLIDVKFRNSRLHEFAAHTLDDARDRYRSLSTDISKLHISRIKSSVFVPHDELPSGVSSGRKSSLTERSLVQHTVGLKKPRLSLRNLFKRAPKSMAGLFPCTMASPSAVADILPRSSSQFDYVIFDEASQMLTGKALGSLARAENAIIVGDSNQLPPTDFFMSSTQNDDSDDDYFMSDDAESVLDLASSCFPPSQKHTLNVHYRSEHESLIAFSNKFFYDNRLFVFPAPSTNSGRLGVSLRRVKGVVTTRPLQNEIEAHHVAQEFYDHCRKYQGSEYFPTVGIAAMNVRQAELIEKIIDDDRSKDPEIDRLVSLAKKSPSEPLFIKNLENVQGDERDVIIVSFTYGPTEVGGKVRQTFGPINSKNGHRRLNVLVTRAKRQLIGVSSMSSSDIVPSDSSSRGVIAFRNYLRYLETGVLPDLESSSGRQPDSDFEISVATALQSLGFEVVAQVGIAGFFIDLAVRHPETGDFVIGIECDGATYHSSRSARERDVIRQEIIESKGWTLHRIWSTDWFTNREDAIDALALSVREAMDDYNWNRSNSDL